MGHLIFGAKGPFGLTDRAVRAGLALLPACEQKETTVTNPPAEKKESNTTVVNPSPATSSKTETDTTINTRSTPSSQTKTESTTTTTSSPSP